MSDRGAQLFEAIGLEKALVEKYFRGIVLADRRHRRLRRRRGSDPHAPRRLRRRPGVVQHAGRWRRIRGARVARNTCGRRTRSRTAAQHPREPVRHLQGLRPDHQRPVAPPHDAARAVRVQDRPGQGDPDRRGHAPWRAPGTFRCPAPRSAPCAPGHRRHRHVRQVALQGDALPRPRVSAFSSWTSPTPRHCGDISAEWRVLSRDRGELRV